MSIHGSCGVLTPYGIKRVSSIKRGDKIFSKGGYKLVFDVKKHNIDESTVVNQIQTKYGRIKIADSGFVISDNKIVSVLNASAIDVVLGPSNKTYSNQVSQHIDPQIGLEINPEQLVLNGLLLLTEPEIVRIKRSLLVKILSLFKKTDHKDLVYQYKFNKVPFYYFISHLLPDSFLSSIYEDDKDDNKYCYYDSDSELDGVWPVSGCLPEHVSKFMSGVFYNSMVLNTIALHYDDCETLIHIQELLSSIGIMSEVETGNLKITPVLENLNRFMESIGLLNWPDADKVLKLIEELTPVEKEKPLIFTGITEQEPPRPKYNYDNRVVFRSVFGSQENYLYEIDVENPDTGFWCGGLNVCGFNKL